MMITRLQIRKGIRAGIALATAFMIGRTAQAAPKIRWTTYKSNLLSLRVSVPAEWTPVKIPKALAFRYEDQAGGTAGVGIMKSDQSGQSIEEAADHQFQNEGSPPDWVRSPARVGGMRAIKIVGLDPKNPDRKIVHYYIEAPLGTYLIQCQASSHRWSTFGPLFAAILTKLTFLQ
jgi:hypothetical protein